MADPIVGIDLGTSNSVVAVCDQGGNVKVLSDDAGFKVQPSVVSFHPNGAVIVGSEAKQRKVLDPKNTVYSAKRLIGRSFRSREVQTAMGRMPYVIREGGNQQPMVVTRAGEFAVPEISAIVLDHMRKLAARALQQDVNRAVVTVPASFTEAQRTATATAGAISGMTIVRVLNEPTAAALAYGHTRQLRRTIAVYDFGGGTFDITILKLDDNVYEVLGTSGDTFLGGDDIDERVVDQLVAGFLSENRIDLRQNEIAMMRLRAVAEQTKIELSRRSRAIIKVDEIAYGSGGAPLNLQQELTRDQLVAGCVDVVDRTFPVCEESLKLAGLRTVEVDDVVLVGGTTKMPYVRDRVAAFFGKAPRTDINPEEAVAIGAALQAAALERILSKRPSIRVTGPMAPVTGDDSLTGEVTFAQPQPDEATLETETKTSTSAQLDSLSLDETLASLGPPTKTGEAPRVLAPMPDVPSSTMPLMHTPAVGTPIVPVTAPGVRPPMTKTRPGQESRGDRPVQRGEAIDRFEGGTNIIPPGAPIARMTKPGAGVPPPSNRTIHGMPAAQVPPSDSTAIGKPPAPPSGGGGAPPPVPARARTGNLGPIPGGSAGPPPSPPSATRPPPITAPGVIPAMPPGATLPRSPFDVPTRPAEAAHSLGETTKPSGDGLEALLLQKDVATKPAGANIEALIRETEDIPTVSREAPVRDVRDLREPQSQPIVPVAGPAAATMMVMPGGPGAGPATTMRGRMDGPASSPSPGSTDRGVPPPGQYAKSGPNVSGGVGGAARGPAGEAYGNLLVPNVIDVTPRAFGIATVAGYCEELIRRNVRLPTETRKTFITSRDRQQVVRIRICQGESRRLEDNVIIGDLVLDNLEARPRGETSIEVTFTIDASGILNVKARDARSGREQSAALDIVGAQSAEEVASSRDRLQQMRR